MYLDPARRRLGRNVLAGATALVLLSACGTIGTATTTSSAGTATGSSAGAATTAASGSLFDSSVVHSISVSYDESEYRAMIDAFTSSGAKNWIAATVTIDGTEFSNVGIKLKGNSTLRGLAATAGNTGRGAGLGGDLSADEPEGLPWRIRLDKFEDGQNYQGETDFVVRGGNTETGLNEAVALELIGAAGLPTEQATPARFSVNGSAATLRLVIENPSENWDSENFDSGGILYKAEAEGDYSYRGADAASYATAFEVEASTSGEDDYTPLIAFLKFVNESDDATFAAELAEHLDVQAFATYLAVQNLVANSDDIDGPGNNSYLRYDSSADSFTVVAWDQNLSFGGMGGGGGVGGGLGGGQRPPGAGRQPAPAPAGSVAGAATGADTPAGAGNRPGGGMRGGNILAERFLANAEFKAMYDAAVTDLMAELYTSGTAQQILDRWTAVLNAQAGDLVSSETVGSEAAGITKFFAGS